MSLVGIYKDSASGAILDITSADNHTGQGAGTFFLVDIGVKVTLNYHFIDGGKGGTTLRLSGAENDPNHYTGSAGYTDTTSGTNGIRLAGGFVIENKVFAFSGLFVKQ